MIALDESVVGLELPVMVECAVLHALTLSDEWVFAVCAGVRRAMPVLSAHVRYRIAAAITAALLDGQVTSPCDIDEWARTAESLRMFDASEVTV